MEGERVSTRDYGWDGISAFGLGNTTRFELAPDEGYLFPDAIFIEGVRYGLVGWTHPGWKYVEDEQSQREDLTGEFLGRQWFNLQW